MKPRGWYETAFESGYLDLYPHRDLASAEREVRGLVDAGLTGRVLDLGCGFGRHALAMHRSGLDVVGLDLSFDLLTHAAEIEGGEALAGRLARGDFRALPFAASAFDGLTMLFSSFGYFDDETNARVLAELARVLRPEGRLVLDLMNAERIRATLVPASRTERGGSVLHEQRRLTDDGKRVRKDVRVEELDGTERRWHEDVRLFDREELAPWLAGHGLELERCWGDFDGSADTAEAPRRIVWARRRGERA